MVKLKNCSICDNEFETYETERMVCYECCPVEKKEVIDRTHKEEHYVKCPACGKKVHINEAVITTRKGEKGIFIYHSNPVCMSKIIREEEKKNR